MTSCTKFSGKPIASLNAIRKQVRTLPRLVAICILVAWTVPANCWAQSGSRSAAPAPARSVLSPQPPLTAPIGQSPVVQSPVLQSPVGQQFPQALQPLQNNFATPVTGFDQNVFNQGVPLQSMPLNQGLTTGTIPFDQAMPGQAIPPSQSMPSSAAGQSGGSSSFGIPESSVVDPIFEINDPNSTIVVDHSSWDNFLAKYVSPDSQGLTRVCYRNVSCQDREALQCYLQQLQSTDVRYLNRNEQLAYWFNLYNARTIAVVLENYPIRSIRQVKQKFTDFVGPFDDEGAVNVLGKSLSLNDIESGIIRPIYNDPRIHYALNCASYGCPNLATRAWQSHDLDARLNAAASDYINSGRAVKSSLCGTKVSKIYKWYAGDFGGEEGVLNHMRQYANCETLQILNRSNCISGYFYDWSLNDAKIQRRRIFERFIR